MDYDSSRDSLATIAKSRDRNRSVMPASTVHPLLYQLLRGKRNIDAWTFAFSLYAPVIISEHFTWAFKMIVTDEEIFNPSVPDLPSKDQVVKLCRQKGADYNRLTYTAPNGKIFFIKYNNATMPEAHAQLFFSSHINANPQSTIRIPELYHAWQADHSYSAYLVMEYIDVHHFASDEERAKALTELIAVKPPPGVLGSFGPPGRSIRHLFFKDQEAVKIYSSVQELQDSINSVSFLHIVNQTAGWSIACRRMDVCR